MVRMPWKKFYWMDYSLYSISSGENSGSFLAHGSQDKSELQELAQLDKRLDGLEASCARLSVNFRDEVPWAGLLGDFSAFAASCDLAISALPPKFYTRSVVPAHLSFDPELYSKVANLLSTKPVDDTVFNLSQFKSQLQSDRNLNWRKITYAEEQIRRRIKVK